MTATADAGAGAEAGVAVVVATVVGKDLTVFVLSTKNPTNRNRNPLVNTLSTMSQLSRKYQGMTSLHT
jgi:hypothetical protein